ncbi:MAG: hypothetical protein AAFN93_12255 [Bacteroidota bacterium]
MNPLENTSMIISHKYKFIFIKTYKTAGTSLEMFLGHHCGPKDIVTPIYPFVDSHKPRNYRGLRQFKERTYSAVYKKKFNLRDFVLPIKFYNHMSASLVRNRINKNIWNKYFKFCIERNPWDKTLSHYHMLNHRADGKLSLDDYFEKQDFCLNYPLYLDDDGSMLVDKVIDYKNLNTELSCVFERLNIDFSGSLEARAKSNYRKNNRPYQEVFSGKQKDIIAEKFQREIMLHEYTY